MTRNWTHIILHHSLTKDSGSVSWGAIERYHRDVKGWRAIGYHFGVETVGLLPADGGAAQAAPYALVGRPLDYAGAHTVGMNEVAIGMCFVGNFDEEPPSAGMLQYAFARVIRPMQRMFNIPHTNVQFHRDYAQKSCPGTLFTRDLIEPLLDRNVGLV